MRKALFLDLDGTVRRCKNPKQVCPNKVGEQVILPNVKEKIRAHSNDGYLIIGVTNQGGVGLGYLEPKTCQEISKETNALMDDIFTYIYEAMASPSEQHPWTKPNPGMLLQAKSDFNIDLENSIMVGDRESDMGAAKNAGVGEFQYAKDFFGWSNEEEAKWRRKD
jgi:D-glycero-D-manno-heptose 1,7-bisphosphate phosphatase